MNPTQVKRIVLSMAAAVAVSCAAAADGTVKTRVFSEAPASKGKEVVTRPIGEVSVPSAGVVHFAISLLPSLETPSEDWSVHGARLNILAGRHRDVAGLDIGILGNITTEDFDGVQLAAGWNSIGRSAGAVQFAGVFNQCEGEFTGLQCASIFNNVGEYCGGVQMACLNKASEFEGLQIGLFNSIDRGIGVQIGVVNSARVLEGLQIGLLNFISDSSVPFFPIVNAAF